LAEGRSEAVRARKVSRDTREDRIAREVAGEVGEAEGICEMSEERE